jgi:hypothetical protein
LIQEIQIWQSFLRRRRTAWKTFDFFGPALQRFPKNFSFASARVVAGHFSLDRTAIKSILDQKLAFRKFTRRWPPHILSAEEKLRRVREAQNLLTILAIIEEKNFLEIITGS